MDVNHRKPKVFDYLDFRLFLRDMIEYLRAKKLYSTRTFAESIGVKGPNFMKMVIDGERNFAEPTITRVAQAFELNAKESEFFYHLVLFNQKKSLEEKNTHYEKLLNSRRFQEVHRLEGKQLELYSHWYIGAIYESIQQNPGPIDLQELASDFGIRAYQVEKALRVLEELELIKRQGKTFKASDSKMSTSPQMENLMVRNYHREMIEKALEALDQMETTRRELGALTLALSPEDFEKFRKELFEMVHQLNLKYSKSTGQKVIYQLNYQVFPLNRGLKS